MFTGIIEEIGIVKDFKKSADNASITIECKKILDDVKLGDSIAVNGVCQTVTSFNSSSFTAQLSAETLKITNFSDVKAGGKVNLERALTLSQRLGGHIVSGHIDGLAKIQNVEKKSNFYNVTFDLNSELARYIVKKGSVAINGISLTVADVSKNQFNVAIIPHTFENTTLKSLNSGDFVNIEVDVLAKYVEKFLSTGDNGDKAPSKINESFLLQNGFF